MKLSLFSLYGAAALVFANGVAADDNENSIVSHKKISRRKLLERTTRKLNHGKGKGRKKCKGEGQSAALEAVEKLKGKTCPLWDECTFKDQEWVDCDYCDFGTGEVIEFFSEDLNVISDYDVIDDFGYSGIFTPGTGVSRFFTAEEAFDCGQIVFDACVKYVGEENFGDACGPTGPICNGGGGNDDRRLLGDEKDSLANKNIKENVAGVPKNKFSREGKDRRLSFAAGEPDSSAESSGAPKVLGSKNFMIFNEGEDKWTCQKQGI